jgi:hypothetical protein
MLGHPLFIYTNDQLLSGHTLLVVSPWLLFCIEALLVSLILVALSVRMVKPIHYRRGTIDREPDVLAEPPAVPAS